MLAFAYHLIRVSPPARYLVHNLIHCEVLSILTTEEQSALTDRLNQFLDAMPFEHIAVEVAQSSQHNVETIAAMLDTYANESRISVGLIADRLKPGLQVLEVGAGLCFTSLFLKAEGYHITALEPAIGGFGMFEQLKNTILKHHAALQLEVITVPAQQLDRKQHGCFDLIFSNNVIEHIPDWQAALTAMTSVLSGQGSMIHACPNYSVPYEPHYGVPVFRRLPGLSRLLFLSSRCDAEIWDSLNFITCRNIRNYCNSYGLTYCFEKELLYNALKRIDDDPLFKERHQGVISSIATFVMRSGLGELIRRIPPAMATPMIVKISKQQEES